MSLLITGASGFLGRRVLESLEGYPGLLYLVVRPASMAQARRLYGDRKDVRLLAGDLRDFGVLTERDHIDELASEVRGVLHMAASYDLRIGASQNYLHNVVGTQNLLGLCDRLTSLETFVSTSTIAVAGDFRGIFHENMFNVGQGFPNPYASTKFRVEGLVGAWKTEVRKYVCRLGILVGDAATGRTDKIDGPYYLLRSLKRHAPLWRALSVFGRTPLPFHPGAPLHIVPVDAVAAVLARIARQPAFFEGRWRTYHLSGPAFPMAEFLERSFQELGHRTRLVPLPRGVVPPALLPRLGIPASLQHCLYSEAQFANHSLREDYPDLSLPLFGDYAEAFYRFVRSDEFDTIAGGGA